MGTRPDLTDGQMLALAALEQRPCEVTTRLTAGGKVNARSVNSLVVRGYVIVEQTLLGQIVSITDAGREALVALIDYESSRPQRQYAPKRKYRKSQPLGSLCVRCNYRPAKPNKRHPHLTTNYCSDECRQIDSFKRRELARIDMANEIRGLLKMPSDRGADFTAPELKTLLRRLRLIVERREHQRRRGVV